MNVRLIAALLASLFIGSSAPTSAQTPTRAQVKAILDDAQAKIDALFTSTEAITVTGGLQGAVDTAPAGSVLRLPAGYVDFSEVTIAKSVAIVGAPASDGTLPQLRGGLAVRSGTVSVASTLVRRVDSRADIITCSGNANLTLTGVLVLGDPAQGQKRGVAANCGRFEMTGSICDHIFATDQDTQCIAAWDATGPFLIENNFLRASGENVLFGGADASSLSRIPSNIVVRGNTMTKDPAWRGTWIQVKNLFELKAARHVLVEKNIFEYCWSAAQQGHAILFTPKNQDGRAPFTVVEDVLFRLNTIRHVTAAMQIVGDDYEHPSGRLRGLKVVQNIFEDVDPAVWRGFSDPTDQMILITRGPVDVEITDNDFSGAHIGSNVYFDEQPKAVALKVTINRWPAAYWGSVFGGNSSPELAPDGLPHAWHDYVDVATSVLSGNVER